MSEFELDLQSAEGDMDVPDTDSVVLGILDGETPDAEWIALVEAGNTLVLDIEGDLSELAAGFATEITDLGGELMHFRGFLVVSPPGRDIDTDRL
ncbi:DUF5779 family protein [Halosegnis longus]|uniref:Uncharacterized protein n=1 Tax=Halosegnis longus TaxID=2216012 RepID=A0AAJ4UVK0_9EURY|nr:MULTISPECIES: DUF5779 family protein [Halobacteriales]RNJ26077.1 hypothetical protein Nmn1133_04850 [Salella cibi]